MFKGSDLPIKEGLLLAQESNFGWMTFLLSSMTHMGACTKHTCNTSLFVCLVFNGTFSTDKKV